MSHPPETSLSSRELTDQIYEALDAVREHIDARQAIIALIDAWVRVREASVAVETAARWHDEIARRCGVEPKELPWTVQWLAEANDALATACKQLEET